MRRKTVLDLHRMKAGSEKIAMITAYDATMARDVIAWSQEERFSQRRFILAMVARPSGRRVGVMPLTRHGAAEGMAAGRADAPGGFVSKQAAKMRRISDR